ncbi:hypothetical protein BpHYR1_019650 [Brachionus plicatilis]|uniref:Uncharacterized protein n=1 Tax=Brachionus plicatilis TaxID=10195 RepID=A0A3M7Q7K6_BRAPC|nr:hypothetical protein BpHYR1_019650 [Brachionus plicatilis]
MSLLIQSSKRDRASVMQSSNPKLHINLKCLKNGLLVLMFVNSYSFWPRIIVKAQTHKIIIVILFLSVPRKNLKREEIGEDQKQIKNGFNKNVTQKKPRPNNGQHGRPSRPVCASEPADLSDQAGRPRRPCRPT